MCLSCLVKNENEQRKMTEFAEWILNIGDGNTTTDDGDEFIKIPDNLLLQKEVDVKETIVQSTYPDLLSNYKERDYLKERAILYPRNDTVQEIDQYIMNKLQGEEVTYLSSDSVCSASTNGLDSLYPMEFLNTLKFPGIPDHELKLKVGLLVMLLRNIIQSVGLCNGTRMTVTQHGQKIIEARIITGTNIAEKVFIPRIIMTPNDTKWPFKMKRRQFPLSVYFAMTTNKSQGQSLQKAGLYLSKQVFCHGQLYVALSRVTSRNGLKILVNEDEGSDDSVVKNIVYK
jgi:hypothetical protein